MPTESAGKASDPVAAPAASHDAAAAPPRAPDSVGASTALSTANNRVTSLLQMRKKRQLQQSMAETVHLSVQLADANQALKRCKKECVEADHGEQGHQMQGGGKKRKHEHTSEGLLGSL